MDTRRLVIGMVLAMAIVFGWQQFYLFLAKKNNWKLPGQETPVVSSTTVPTTAAAVAPPPGTQTAPPAIASAPAAVGLRVAEVKEGAAPSSIGSAATKDLTYAMQLSIDPAGAGLSSAVLNEFKKTVKSNEPYTFQQPYEDHSSRSRPLATRWISIDDRMIDLAGKPWRLEQSGLASATYSLEIVDEKGPVARLRKKFEVFPIEDKQKGFEAKATTTIENLTDRALRVKAAMNAVVPPLQEIEGVDDRQIIAGYPKNSLVEVEHSMVGEYVKDTHTRDLTKSKAGQPVWWVGASSVYFDAIVRPEPPTGGAVAMPIAKAEASALNQSETDATKVLVVTTMETDAVTIPASGKAELPLNVFLGPKIRKLLNNGYFSAPPLGYNATLATNQSSCGNYCTFGWLINSLVGLLGFFHIITRDWGLAIICLVIVVRVLLHPITKRSTISMSKMGKMGPEMERLKKKHGDNKDELNKAMMQLYKEQGFTPVLGCLPMFLQMPIWIALYSSLQNTFELRQAPFLYGWTWIKDLATPDALISFSSPLPLLFGWHLRAINVLPLLLAVVFYLQQKYTPKPAAMTPEQQQQQKMMLWMSVLLFPLMLYTGPSGLNLYILTSTTVGIIESKRIRDHIKEREEAEKAGRVFVDSKPTRSQRKKKDSGDDESKPKTRLAGWLARLQEKADELQRDAKRNNKGRDKA